MQPLPKSPNDVSLTVRIEPLDVGYVKIVGGLTLSIGDAEAVNKNDEIKFIARPFDAEQWRFGHWGEALHPNWSSDGTKITFSSVRDGNREIYVMNADGSN